MNKERSCENCGNVVDNVCCQVRRKQSHCNNFENWKPKESYLNNNSTLGIERYTRAFRAGYSLKEKELKDED